MPVTLTCGRWSRASFTHLHPVAGTASTHLINRVSEDLVVYADASLLRRVIENLIANAIRYTPRGEVTIVRTRELWRRASWNARVSDNGAGIPEERLDKVFEPFETDPEKEERAWACPSSRPSSRLTAERCPSKVWRGAAPLSGSRYPRNRSGMTASGGRGRAGDLQSKKGT